MKKGDKGMIDATDALLTEQQSKSAEAELAKAKKLSAAAKKVIKGGESKVSMEPTFGKYKGQRIEKGTPEYEKHIKSQEWKDYLSGKIDKDGNKIETSDVKNYKQGKGLTGVANNQLFAVEPEMRGKSPTERIKRYEELFINNLASL